MYFDNKLRLELLEAVKVLELVPTQYKDYHPDSGSQVLDLVHPSLYCYVNGVSRILLPKQVAKYKDQFKNKDCDQYKALANMYYLMGTGTHCDAYSMEQKMDGRFKKDYSFSEKYSWLPSEFKVDDEGKVQIQSYINNLHPLKHKTLYYVIERIFEQFVPMFNFVLNDVINPRPYRVRDFDAYKWYPPEPDYHKINDNWEDWEETKINHIQIPKVIPFGRQNTLYHTDIQPWFDCKGKTLQVIVKLANIELTPESPEYKGGSWHIEGMKNENIMASGIYYYESENISESLLSFRRAIREPKYEQNDDEGIDMVYGMRDGSKLNEFLGSIITQTGRAICFQNLFQHQVQPFKLIDPTKPGHRKILVFFLVDPTQPILSTLHVPPQQSKDYHYLLLFHPAGLVLTGSPKVINEMICEYIDFPMSLEEAKEHRIELMNERKEFIIENNKEIYLRNFSLCEH